MTGKSVPCSSGAAAVLGLVDTISANRARLSEIDGAIGDGDHGVNMATGFTHFREQAEGKQLTFAGALELLGTVLLETTGGSLGPLYGGMFLAMGEAAVGKDAIDADGFYSALVRGRGAVMEIGGAKPGDKTLLEVLCPAVEAFGQAKTDGKDFADCLITMKAAADQGLESTRGMVAKVGRASRLGERSRGVLDAGAASCALILNSFADSFLAELDRGGL